VPRGVNDDLLPFEGGVQVWHHAHLPAGSVRLAPRGKREGLGRRPVLAAFVEGTALQLLGGFRIGLWLRGAGPVGSSGRDDDLAAGERVGAEVDSQVPSPPPRAAWTRGPINSIGSGRMSVEVRSELISSIVCR
jgi:hypothetical protein